MLGIIVVGDLHESDLTLLALSVLHGDPGFCISEHLTAVGKVVLECGLAMSVGVAMLALYYAVGAVRRVFGFLRGERGPGGSHGNSEMPLLPGNATIPRPVHIEVIAAPLGSLIPAAVNQSTRIITAVINVSLFAWSSVANAVFTLLRCSPAPGAPPGQSSLFIQGSVVCNYGGWQLPLMVLLVGLLLAPPAVAYVAWTSLHPQGHGGCARVGLSCCSGSTMQRERSEGTRLALVESYRKKAWMWEAMLMTQRMVRVAAFKLGNYPLHQVASSTGFAPVETLLIYTFAVQCWLWFVCPTGAVCTVRVCVTSSLDPVLPHHFGLRH
jgi:hypothetical protein